MIWKFFKREEKLPFSYPSIEERMRGRNYTLWIIGVVLLMAIGLAIYLLL